MPRLEIDFPEEFRRPPGQAKVTLKQLTQEASLVRVYQLGEISSGRAAELLQQEPTFERFQPGPANGAARTPSGEE